MPIATNVVRRKGSLNYYVRVTVPKELRAVWGKREIWRTLGTSNRKKAIASSYAVLADIQILFAGGHVKATTTAKYGTEKSGTIIQRSEWVEAVKYEGLDLSHLTLEPLGAAA